MKKYLAIALLPIVVLLAIVAFWQPTQVTGQGNIPCYRMQGGAKNVAGSGCEYEFQSGATLEAQQGSYLSVGGQLLAPAQTPIAVVHQTPFSPNGFYQPIIAQTATAVVSFTVPSVPGIYVIENIGGANITLDDAGNTVLAGDFSMGQYDTIIVKSDATRVVELSRTNN